MDVIKNVFKNNYIYMFQYIDIPNTVYRYSKHQW